MDRSFLTDEKVVAASRQFVCIRLATYEDEKEAKYLKSFYTTRSGVLENTVFGILSPNGKKQLTRTGRGPHFAFRNSDHMASQMMTIAADYPGAKKNAGNDIKLPLMKNLDLALNVAASDNLPIIVSVADNQTQLDELNAGLLPLAWRGSLTGQFVFASVLNKKELKPLAGVDNSSAVLIVEPDQFGLSGKVLAQFETIDELKQFGPKLTKIVADFPRREKDHDSHVRLGIQLGIDWESKLPETDPMSIEAKARARDRR